MGMRAGSEKMRDVTARGGSAQSASVRGTAAGLIEAATEKLPLDSVMKLAKGGSANVLKDVLKQAFTEASEESISYVANDLIDRAYNDPNAPKTWREYLSGLGQSALGGLLSGGLMGAGSVSVGNTMQSDARSMQNALNEAATQQTQAQVYDGTAAALNNPVTAQTTTEVPTLENMSDGLEAQRVPVVTQGEIEVPLLNREAVTTGDDVITAVTADAFKGDENEAFRQSEQQKADVARVIEKYGAADFLLDGHERRTVTPNPRGDGYQVTVFNARDGEAEYHKECKTLEEAVKEVTADGASSITVTDAMPKNQKYRYYSKLRPVGPGTYPGKPVAFTNFDERTNTDGIDAWGYLEYDQPLTPQQIDDYDLAEAAAQNSSVDNLSSMGDNLPTEVAEDEREGVGNLRCARWLSTSRLKNRVLLLYALYSSLWP